MSEMAPMPAKKSAIQVKFEKAEKLVEEGKLADALTLFAEVAKDDDWFYKAYDYLVRVSAQLKKSYRRNSPEVTRITELEQALERNKARLENIAGRPIPRDPGPAYPGQHDLIAPDGDFLNYREDDDSPPASTPTDTPKRQRRGAAPPIRGRSSPVAARYRDPATEKLKPRTEQVETGRDIIERVPHIDVIHDGPVRPGDVFDIALYLNTLPRRAGETGSIW
jgi:hypothetical protein